MSYVRGISITLTLPPGAAEALTAVSRMKLQRPGQVVADLLYRYLPDFASELVEADLRPPIDVESRTGDLIAGAIPGAIEDRLSDDRLALEVTP